MSVDYFGAAVDEALGVTRAIAETERAELNDLRRRALEGDESAIDLLIELGDGEDPDPDDDWTSGT